ncbi:MAG: thermonuclease family protein [Myxococcota bacterium]
MRWLLLVICASGCEGLDRIPIVVGTEDDPCAPEREEEVACTLDGDTFQVGACGGESVRLLGVSAPEIAHDESETDECWGPEAATWLDDLLVGVTVRLSFDAVCEDTYERTLAYAWIDESVDGEEESRLVNEEIIRAGYARVYEDFDDIRLADRLYEAEAAAQEENLGLWAVCE